MWHITKPQSNRHTSAVRWATHSSSATCASPQFFPLPPRKCCHKYSRKAYKKGLALLRVWWYNWFSSQSETKRYWILYKTHCTSLFPIYSISFHAYVSLLYMKRKNSPSHPYEPPLQLGKKNRTGFVSRWWLTISKESLLYKGPKDAQMPRDWRLSGL